MDDRLEQAISCIRAGNRQEAGRMLSALLKEDPLNEGAWLWLTLVVGSVERRRFCLEKVLEINPGNEVARSVLEKLEDGDRSAASEMPTAPVALRAAAEPAAPPAVEEPIPKPCEEEFSRPSQPPAGENRVARSRADGVPVSPAEYTRTDYVITIGWLHPQARPDRVVLLEPKALVVANPALEYIAHIRQQLVVGPVPHQLLGLAPLIIPLEQIERVTAAVNGRRLKVNWREGRRWRSATVLLSGWDDCCDAFNALQRRLGRGYARRDRRGSRLVFALALLAVAALIAFAGNALLQRIPESSALVFAAGGLLALAALLWLLPNLFNPPQWITIEREKPPRQVR